LFLVCSGLSASSDNLLFSSFASIGATRLGCPRLTMLLHAATLALALAATASATSAHVIRRQDPAVSATPSIGTPNVEEPAASAHPSPPVNPDAKGCEAISLAFKAAEAGTSPIIRPSVALACLESVPVDVERDVALMEFLLPYLPFQSTVGYLKKPPQGYLLPAVDIIGGSLAIREKLRKGGYKNQFEFVLDIQRMIAATGDGHVAYTPALLGAFQFTRSLNITSVSSDGLELPKIYDVADVVSPGDSVSDIESIDDVPVQDFLAKVAAEVTTQDPDAQFNYLFWSIPSGSSSFTTASSLPDSHTVKFANGTTRVYPNSAIALVDFTNIASGEALHTAVEIPPEITPAQAAAALKIRRRDAEPTEDLPPFVTSVPYYPDPVLIQRYGYFAGYFLNSTAHADTAVLAVTSFAPSNDTVINAGCNPEYLATRTFLREFFAQCAKEGRTKLIIDLSNNGGGLVMQGFELYRTLFPTGKAYSGARFRAHAAMKVMGTAAYNTPDEESVFMGYFLSPSTSKRYPDFPAIYGPASFPEDHESNLFEYDFSDVRNNLDVATNSTFLIAGFDPADPPPPQPFKAEDITILADGKCASTCTVFVSLMVHEQRVRTVALGGRPLAQPMQAVGGVKGSLVMKLQSIQSVWNTIVTKYNPTIPANLVPGLPTNGTPPLMPIDLTTAQVNYRNAHLEKDPNGPPTQFVYEAANCRRFNKASYLTDITTLWTDIADVAWKGGKCAPGSTPDSSGKIGDAVLGWSDKVLSRVNVYDGPGSQTNQEWLALATKNLTGTAEGLSNGVGRVKGGMMGIIVAVVVGFVGLL